MAAPKPLYFRFAFALSTPQCRSLLRALRSVLFYSSLIVFLSNYLAVTPFAI